MIAMGMMQPSAHEVIDMVAMGHGFVPAGRAMLVRAARLRRALHGIGGIDWDHVLVDVILVHVVKMAVMEIIDMSFMADRCPRARHSPPTSVHPSWRAIGNLGEKRGQGGYEFFFYLAPGPGAAAVPSEL